MSLLRALIGRPVVLRPRACGACGRPIVLVRVDGHPLPLDAEPATAYFVPDRQHGGSPGPVPDATPIAVHRSHLETCQRRTGGNAP